MNTAILHENNSLNCDVQDYVECTPCQDEKQQKGLMPEKGPEYGKPRASSYKCTAKKPSKRHLERRRELVYRNICVSVALWLALTLYAGDSSLPKSVPSHSKEEELKG